MDNNIESNIFLIISHSGEAKSSCLEAISLAKNGEFESAQIQLEDAKKLHQTAQEYHLQLVTQEAQDMSENKGSIVSLLMAHAEDQMMSVEIIHIMAQELIDIYKKLSI